MQATSGEYVRKQREENSKGSKKSIAFYSFAQMTNFRAELQIFRKFNCGGNFPEISGNSLLLGRAIETTLNAISGNCFCELRLRYV